MTTILDKCSSYCKVPLTNPNYSKYKVIHHILARIIWAEDESINTLNALIIECSKPVFTEILVNGSLEETTTNVTNFCKDNSLELMNERAIRKQYDFDYLITHQKDKYQGYLDLAAETLGMYPLPYNKLLTQLLQIYGNEN